MIAAEELSAPAPGPLSRPTCFMLRCRDAEHGYGLFATAEEARAAFERVGNSSLTWYMWELVAAKGPHADRMPRL